MLNDLKLLEGSAKASTGSLLEARVAELGVLLPELRSQRTVFGVRIYAADDSADHS